MKAMGIHQNADVGVDHGVLRRDLRAIALLSVLLFGAIFALSAIEARTGILAALASRGA